MIDYLTAFDRLDQASLRAFSAAARAQSFTKGAELAAMTQSGVSQHVARLERELGAQLFTRIKRQVSLTRAGELLRDFVGRQVEEADRLLDEVHGEVGRLSGTVRYAMPHSCLFTPHLSALLKKRRAFSDVSLEVSLCPNEGVLAKLLARSIDFGFMTRRFDDPALHFEVFCREQYILVGHDRAQVQSLTRSNLLAQKFVTYPGMDALFEMWARHHFPRQPAAFQSLRSAGSIDSLHGAITMLRHGVGLSVFPKHCVEGLIKENAAYEFVQPGKGCLNNEVWIVTLAGATPARRTKAVLDAFWSMKKQSVSVS